MKHGNIAIFVPHNGCPHQCSFCDQREITGHINQPSAEDVKITLDKAVSDLKDKTKDYEIAFFGGSFTAIDKNYMISLLDAAKPYINRFKGIRVSTRPDYIDKDILILLKQYGTTTIELGAQSMDNSVLYSNNRGHSAEDVFNSSLLIKSYGINLGLQMMTGLYKSDFNKDIYTADEFIKLKPDCVRIYPTVIMKNTELERLYKSRKYIPYTLDESVDLCAGLIEKFYKNDIDVIRVGLHFSDSLIKNDIAKIYHPAFKELCENKLFFNNIKSQLINCKTNEPTVYVNPKSLSKAIGQNKSNIKLLNESGYNIRFKTDDKLNKYDIKIGD